MFTSEKFLHVAIVLTVSLSGLLLGLGQRDLTTTIIAIGGAFGAFLITELFRWFRFDQWFANLAAILVTGYALLGFGGGDRVYQLMIVANLLVYLQTILLFQKKTPRLYWQVLVLSLLQVVVAAVFNLGFEGGVLFIVYMIVAGGTTMLLHLHHESWNVRHRNEETQLKLESRIKSSPDVKTIWFDPHPVAIYDQENRDQRVLGRQLRHYTGFGFAALIFAVLLFAVVPRDASSWAGPRDQEARQTGASKYVNLDFSGVIQLSSELAMRVTYTDPNTDEKVQLVEPPYLRGMPLSHVSYSKGSTTWRAPYDLISETSFEPPIDRYPFFERGNNDYMLQTIVLEPTNDPLLYSADPYFRHGTTLSDVKYCLELNCLTRVADRLPNSTFEYSLAMFASAAQPNLTDYVPFGVYPEDARRVRRSQGALFPELLEMDYSRYPVLARKAEQLSGRLIKRDITDFEVAKNLEQHFLDSANYVYTLDLGSFRRDRSLDPVEDFVKNHHSGHCEFFASALTLMLRSQQIPARLVVGYRGGEFSPLGKYYRVQQQHAHAWVEAYIKPSDISDTMARSSPLARRQGVWLRLDPTPSSDFGSNNLLSNATDALGYARAFWNDYVLRMSGDGDSAFQPGASSSRMGVIGNIMNLDTWGYYLRQFREALTNPNSPFFYFWFLVPAVMVWYGIRQWKRNHQIGAVNATTRRKAGIIRQFLGNTLRVISPRLGNWIRGTAPQKVIEVPFYQSLSQLLARYRFHRIDSNTQLEFANQVSCEFHSSPHHPQINQLLRQLTDLFYQVRFGGRSLSQAETSHADEAIRELETLLKHRHIPEQK